MFNIGIIKALRDLIAGFGGFISAFARVGRATDKVAQVAEESATLFVEQVQQSREQARLSFEESLKDQPTAEEQSSEAKPAA